RFEVEIYLSVMLEGVRKQVREYRGNRTVKVCRTYADTDQGKHVQTSMNDRAPGAHKKNAAAPKHDDGRQDQLNPLVNPGRHQLIQAQTWNHLTKSQEK